MWKVCALGAAGASEREILGSMRGSLATQTGLEIDQHFWFYLPRALLESCEFWRFIKANFGRFHKFELPTKVNSHEALFNL
jgi:hypothetical protein